MFNDDWDAAVPLYPPSTTDLNTKSTRARPPITLLVISVGTNIFFDPSHAELAVADAVVAVTIASPSTSEPDSLNLLAIRTIDPPSRLSASAADAETGGVKEEEGVWKAKKGGVRRDVLGRMVGMCTERGGVGAEVLDGLEGFT